MQKVEINIKERNFSKINIKKRTKENYTHMVNIDSKIISVTTWRKSKLKFRLNLITNFFTLGILHIISLFIPKLYLKIYCKESLPNNSDFFLIEDIYNNFTLCKTNYNKSSKRKMSNNSNSHNNNKNNDNHLSISFEYKSIKYKFDDDSNSIIPIYFNLSLYSNRTIINSFNEGVNTSEKYIRKIKKYGQNIMKMNINLIFQNMIKKDIPQCMNAFISGIISLLSGVYVFGLILIGLSISILIAKIIYRYIKFYKNYERDYSIDGITEYKVKRKYLKEKQIHGFNKIKNIDLVPGDILSLNEGEILPCDCIILDGECVISESNLLGKIDTSIKSSLRNDSNLFNYEANKYCILFHGMEILKIYSKSSYKNLVVLVINTGINTYKANLLSNLLYKNLIDELNKEVYGFFFQNYYTTFIIVMTFISIINIIVSSFIGKKNYSIFYYISIIICHSFMPMYYIINCNIKFFGISNLNNDDNVSIQCVDESRLIESGKINRVIFDKTGTLTNNENEIIAFIPLYYDNLSYKFYFKIYEKQNIKKICDEHLLYYRYLLTRNSNQTLHNPIKESNYEKINSLKNKNYKNSIKENNSHYELSALFLQCLVCCSHLLKINNEICGNIIEKEIIELMKWDINTVEIISENSNNLDSKNKENSENIINKIHRIGSVFFNNSSSMNINYYNLFSSNIISEVFPKNYYRITEGIKLSKMNAINLRSSLIRKSFKLDKSKINSFKLIIISRFFSKSYMNISCIVYNFIEDNYRFMIKGPPEKILKYCINISFPEIDKILSKGLKEGYKVIACATKIIQYNENEKNLKEEHYLKDLNFCGFIFLKNKLKEESKLIIEKLTKMECDTVMSTGDSFSNSIGVGLESGIIKEKKIYIFDLNLKGKKPKIVVSNLFNDLIKWKEKDYDKEIKTFESSQKTKSGKKKDESYLDKRFNYNDKNINQKITNEITGNNQSNENSNKDKKDNLAKMKISINNISSVFNDEEQQSYIPLSSNKTQKEDNISKINEVSKNKTRVHAFLDANYFNDEEVNNSPISYYFNEEENFNSYINNKNTSNRKDYESSRKSLKHIFKNEIEKEQFKYMIPAKKKISNGFEGFHLNSKSPYKNLTSGHLLMKNKNLRSDDLEILKSEDKSNQSTKQLNNIIYSGSNHPKKNKYLHNNISNINEMYSYYNNDSFKKISFEYSIDKIKYFNENCTLCLSGIVLRYIYDKRNEKEIKILLKYIKKFGKIFFSMSSSEKSLLIKINKQLFNKKVCMVGDGANDIEAILSANVGIYIGQRKNLNSLLSHYLISEDKLIDIVTIIKNGRGYYENDNLLLPVNAIFTLMWITLVILSDTFNSKVDNIMLTLLSLTVFFLCILSFTLQPDYNIYFNYLTSNEKLIKRFNFFQFLGMYLIKLTFQLIGIYSFHYNENLELEKRNKVILTYIFILIWSQSITTIFVFNINTFYRKSILTNLPFLIIYTITIGYIIFLLTLNDIAIGNISSVFLTFELDKENVDIFDDTHKLYFLYIILGDSIISYAYIKILKKVFDKIANKQRQDREKDNK